MIAHAEDQGGVRIDPTAWGLAAEPVPEMPELEERARAVLARMEGREEVTRAHLESAAANLFPGLSLFQRRQLAGRAWELYQAGARPGEDDPPPAAPAARPLRTSSAAVAVEEEGPVVQQRPKRKRWTRPDAPEAAPEAQEEPAPTSRAERKRVLSRLRAVARERLSADPDLPLPELRAELEEIHGGPLADHSFYGDVWGQVRRELGLPTRQAGTGRPRPGAGAHLPTGNKKQCDPRPDGMRGTAGLSNQQRERIRARIREILEERPAARPREVRDLIANGFRRWFSDVEAFVRHYIRPVAPEYPYYGSEPDDAPPPRRWGTNPPPAPERPQAAAVAAPSAPAAGPGIHLVPGEGGRARLVVDVEADQATALRLLAAVSSMLAGVPAPGS